MLVSKSFYLGADSLGIEIVNTVDITQTSNFELVMRLSTNINSSDEFFTDLNGYQVSGNLFVLPLVSLLNAKLYLLV